VLELAPTGRITDRLGLDRRPIDARDPLESAWLRACIWPGQEERQRRLDAALAEISSALEAGRVRLVAREALEFAEELSLLPQNTFVLAYQSIFVEYLDAATRADYERSTQEWLHGRPGRALWVEFETAPPGEAGPVTIRAHTSGETFVLAQCEYHPASVAVNESALAALNARLAT
jgi:hypothetical protein